jgi:hypothetical protein
MSKAIVVNGCITAFWQLGLALSGISVLHTTAVAQMTDSSGRQLDEIMVVAQNKGSGRKSSGGASGYWRRV